jgi:hypothetical protein
MQRSTSRLFQATISLLLLAGLGAIGGAGCNKSEAATSREHQSKLAGSGAPAAKVETEYYKIEIRPKGSYSKDAEGTVEISLETKADYHINEQYPYKFTPKSGVDGVTYKGPVGREGGKFEQTKATITVPFTPTKAGKLPVGGRLSLSVCSDKNCLMDKVELSLDIDVK